jgi:hypothetical protein
VENPGWLIDASGKMNENLKVAVETTLAVLRARGDKRLSTETALKIIRESLKAVATRAEFLNTLPPETAKGGRLVIGEALDVILSVIFDPTLDVRVAWRLLRNEVIEGTVRVGLEGLTKTEPSAENIKALRTFMTKQVNQIASGKAWNLNVFESGLLQSFVQA